MSRSRYALLRAAAGLLPQANDQGAIETRRIDNNHQLQVARLMAKANEFIVARAYPHRVSATLDVTDPLDEIAKLVGFRREDIPSIDELMDDRFSVVD